MPPDGCCWRLGLNLGIEFLVAIFPATVRSHGKSPRPSSREIADSYSSSCACACSRLRVNRRGEHAGTRWCGRTSKRAHPFLLFGFTSVRSHPVLVLILGAHGKHGDEGQGRGAAREEGKGLAASRILTDALATASPTLGECVALGASIRARCCTVCSIVWSAFGAVMPGAAAHPASGCVSVKSAEKSSFASKKRSSLDGIRRTLRCAKTPDGVPLSSIGDRVPTGVHLVNTVSCFSTNFCNRSTVPQYAVVPPP